MLDDVFLILLKLLNSDRIKFDLVFVSLLFMLISTYYKNKMQLFRIYNQREFFYSVLETIRVIIRLNSRYFFLYCWLPIEKVPVVVKCSFFHLEAKVSYVCI